MGVATTDLAPHDEDGETEGRLGRVTVRIPVHLSNHDGQSLGVTKNISVGGMFVATPFSLRPGDRVTARLSILDEAEAVEIEAEIRWSRRTSDGDDKPAGIGLRFIDPLLEAAIFVRVLLRLGERNWA